MWVCNLCRKQQEILTKSGAWFFEGGPQGKKAKLQDPSLYPPYQGASGDLTPASDRSRPHGGLLRRQTSLDNGAGPRYSAPGDAPIDRSVLYAFFFFLEKHAPYEQSGFNYCLMPSRLFVTKETA